MVLTQRHEQIKGSALTGPEGQGRTYNLIHQNSQTGLFIINVAGSMLQQGVHWTKTGDTITFSDYYVFDDQDITLDYLTGTGSVATLAGFGYCTTSDVYRTSGISSTQISETDVSRFIEEAEAAVCRYTHYLYWKRNLEAETVTSAASTSLTKSGAGWTVNDYANQYIHITSGTGAGQVRKVISNTIDTLTIDRAWTINPSTDSEWNLFYVPPKFNPYRQEDRDGNNQTFYFTRYTPLREIDQLVIGSTTVTPSKLYKYEVSGQIKFRSGAEASKFSATEPQSVHLKYWYGQDDLPYDAKRLVEVLAALMTLNAQMGGTFDKPSTIGLPEFNITIGQQYINIEGTIRRLEEEYQRLSKTVNRQPVL